MNITYLIGNGFDVNLGLKTRYVDFYKYYVNRDNPDAPDAVKRFKSEINDFIKAETKKQDEATIDWRDLEVALGKWTPNLKAEEVETLYLDIIDSLRDYLISEFKYCDASAFSSQEFLRFLLDPLTGNFSRVQKENIKSFWNGFSSPDIINVINFNYTHTIERLVSYKGPGRPIGDSIIGHKTILQNIFHIHQTLDDEEILVGLNDASQLANKDFHGDSHICNLLLKPKTNALLGTGIDHDCEEIISHTNLFVLFGTSAGITDRKWWWHICNRLQENSARMIYFVHSPEEKRHLRLRHDVMSREAIRQFIKSTGIKEETFLEPILSKSFVCFTPGMFNLVPNYNGIILEKKTYEVGNSNVEITLIDKGLKYVTLSIDAPDEKTGVQAEHEWIKEIFPDYQWQMQSLAHYEVDGKQVPFDRIRISSEDCIKDIYFDISSFFGKGDDFNLVSIPKERKNSSLKEMVRKSY